MRDRGQLEQESRQARRAPFWRIVSRVSTLGFFLGGIALVHWWSPGSVFASIITRLLLMGLAGYGIAHLHPRIKRTSGFLADIVAFVLGVLAFFLLTAVWFR